MLLQKRGGNWQPRDKINIMTKAAAQSSLPRPLLEKPIHPKSVPKWVTVKQEKEKTFCFQTASSNTVIVSVFSWQIHYSFTTSMVPKVQFTTLMFSVLRAATEHTAQFTFLLFFHHFSWYTLPLQLGPTRWGQFFSIHIPCCLKWHPSLYPSLFSTTLYFWCLLVELFFPCL